ncbi:hypothetical protein CLCR_07761 [Cladophialophora carrionii]|uniref:Uncharacterized protein n=1 Tax=Cladophialophora carrionii TaxID=86049 RepID=A0A1C1CNT9_9EURO|nr:hypothetical protein CLCR_07761 [Cladophialophora carrionii]
MADEEPYVRKQGNDEEDDTQYTQGQRGDISTMKRSISMSINVGKTAKAMTVYPPVYDDAGGVIGLRSRPVRVNIAIGDGAAVVVRHGRPSSKCQCGKPAQKSVSHRPSADIIQIPHIYVDISLI